MKKILILVLLLVWSFTFNVKADTVVTTTTTTTSTGKSVVSNSRAPGPNVVYVNNDESDLYHREVEPPYRDNNDVLWVVGTGAAVGAVAYNQGYRRGRRRYRRHW